MLKGREIEVNERIKGWREGKLKCRDKWRFKGRELEGYGEMKVEGDGKIKVFGELKGIKGWRNEGKCWHP